MACKGGRALGTTGLEMLAPLKTLPHNLQDQGLHTLSPGTDDSHVLSGVAKWHWHPLPCAKDMARFVGLGSNSNN